MSVPCIFQSCSQAISRYGRLMKQAKSLGQSSSTVKTDSSTHSIATQAVHDLTEATSALLLRGKLDIYQCTRKDLMDELPQQQVDAREVQTVVSRPKVEAPSSSVQWEYQGKADGAIHGPFTTQQMQSWIQQGYFMGDNAVNVRWIQQTPKDLTLEEDLLADLEDADDDAADALEEVRGEWIKSDMVDFGGK
jgi:CD2 antigen cytoplasmic tail-binding protein 2